MSSLIAELKNIGLSEKEAKVYLANLELGPASVADIAKEAGINRATTYVILEKLLMHGLCGNYDQDKKTLYAANSPESLEGIFEVQKKEIDEKRKNLEKIIPQLRLIDNQKTGKPVVKFFEGSLGMGSSLIELYNSIPNEVSAEPIRMFYPMDQKNIFYSDQELVRLREMRLKKKIKTKVLCTSLNNVESTSDGERLKIDKEQFPITADINIYKDTVRIASLGKKISSILIKDKEIANTLKSLFDLAWEAAKARQEKNK